MASGASRDSEPVASMKQLLFVVTPNRLFPTSFSHPSPFPRIKWPRDPHQLRQATCQASPITILPSPSGEVTAATRRSARVLILTDFTSNPLAAVQDRASDPLSACMLLVAASLGAIISGFTTIRKRTPVVSAPFSPSLPRQSNTQQGDDDDGQGFFLSTQPNQIGRPSPGENSLWLNMSLRTIWRLFRKSTNSLTKDVLQPVLNDMELPPMVESVVITKLTLGESPALVRKIRRLPSRSLSEIQYQFELRLVGDNEGRVEMDVAVRLPATKRLIIIPISVSSLDIDAQVWMGFTLIPYKPWIKFAQWALFSMPIVKLKLQIADYLPVSMIPFLSNILNKILTKDVPKEFLFPRTQYIDLMEDDETNVEMEKDVLEARGISMRSSSATEQQLREKSPELVNLFNVLDMDDDGILSPKEVSNGLIEWGYASDADRNSIANLLDINDDGKVDMEEFVSVWGDLKNVFVPRRFRGVLNGLLLRAEELRTPTFGRTNPYVVLEVESQSTVSKKNNETSEIGSEKGTSVWNEGWELFVQNPRTAVLRVKVLEGCYLTYYRDAIAPPNDSATHSGAASTTSPVAQANGLSKIIGYGSIPVSEIGNDATTMWIDLAAGGGRVRMDVQFNEFVDPRVP